jgi:SNF2 family DNA or RNA helicase
LRRLKQRVLEELPAKIEDIRFCELTAVQVKLYRDAIASRAAGIMSRLQRDDEAVPYIHIFALLTLLKQICNHPALVGQPELGGNTQESGKWEVFTELLTESLASGRRSSFTANLLQWWPSSPLI